MLKSLNKLFTETLKLDPDLWLIVLVAIVAAVFLATLVIGLVTGEFKKIKSLMKGVVSKPSNAVACMKQMPVAVKSQYKRARMSNVRPSDFVTENECVTVPYNRSLISKVWLITFVTTVICGLIAFFVAPCAQQVAASKLAEGGTLDESVEMAQSILPLTVFLVGGILTLIGAIVGKLALGGAIKTYALFAPALDGDGAHGEAVNMQAQQRMQQMQQMQAQQMHAQQMQAQPVFDGQGEPEVHDVNEERAQEFADRQEPDNNEYIEPTIVAEPVTEIRPEAENFAAEPVMEMQTESEEEIRRRAREEAIAQARAAQEAAQAQAAAQSAAQAQARAAQEAAQAQAAQAAAQARAAAQAHTAATPSSADAVIARIEQIDREGAPRETMREVATLLQQERAKPENKTPEQQKKLNEALSKLLRAMSSASRK